MFGLFAKKGKTAHLGEENKLYYNEELKRWVERGKEHEVEEETIPPPPMVSPSTEALTQKRPDTADPSSRYVVAGGFGKAVNESSEHEKFSFQAPAAISAPKTTGFLVPAVLPSEQSTPHEDPSSEAVETQKYKGFRIPKFRKPESFDGTQQEYEEKELTKWKAKIDKREARKQNGIDTISPKTQNSRKGSGKLDNDWLMEEQSTPDLAFIGTQSFTAVEEIFTPDLNPALNPEDRNQPIGVFPMNPNQEPVSMKSDWDNPVQEDYREQNGHHSWKNNDADPIPPQLEDEVDFDSWDKAVEEPIVPVEAMDENPYKEAEYPGGIRETEDPFDIAWLTQTGWNDQEQCRSITHWMCHNYQQEWRAWHRSNPIWDQFWCWYYDGGDEIIHSSALETKANEHANMNGLHGVDALPMELNSESGPLKEDLDYVPDEDIWGVPETQETSIENQQEFQSQNAWMETPQLKYDDNTNVGILPFEIFNHDGMLQFLLKLDSIFNDLTPQSLTIGEFHQQIKQLMVAVEAQNQDKNHSLTNSAASKEVAQFQQDLQRKEQQIEALQLVLESSSNQNSNLEIKLKDLEELISKQEQTIEALKTKVQNSESALEESGRQLEASSHQIKSLEDQMESKESELLTLRDQLRNQVKSNNELVHTSSEESEKLKKENKILKKKVLSLLKKSEDQISSNPASPISVTNDQCFIEKPPASANQNSESDGQVTKQINLLKRKLQEQKKALEEKESQISGLLETEKTKIEIQEALDDTKKDLEAKIRLNDELNGSLLLKENEIFHLRNEVNQRLQELDELKQKEEPESVHEMREEDVKDRRLARLEDDLHQKQQDIRRLEIQIQSIPQKDSLISKLTALIGENDSHLQQLRISLEQNRKKEVELLDSLSAKDVDLENLVNSVMISQKQIIQLQDYCFQLGGNPSEVLINQSLGN